MIESTFFKKLKNNKLFWNGLIIILIINYFKNYLINGFPISYHNADNVDSYYPNILFFLKEFDGSAIKFINEYIWSGSRIVGSPAFNINPFQVMGYLIAGEYGLYISSNYTSVLEVIIAATGMFYLLDVQVPRNLRIEKSSLYFITTIISLSYVFSSAYSELFLFSDRLSLFFATLPWILYFYNLYKKQHEYVYLLFCGLILAVQYIYGFLQFSIYTSWIILFYIIFQNDYNFKRKILNVVNIFLVASLISSIHLFPIVDNIFFQTFSDNRINSNINYINQLEHWGHVLNLFSFEIFKIGLVDYGVGNYWWPISVDNWSRLEVYNGYNGVVLTIISIFAVISKAGPLYFRLLFIILILLPITKIGVMILYVLNLFVSVPYGRITNLLPFVISLCSFHFFIKLVDSSNYFKKMIIFKSIIFLLFFGIVYMWGLPQFFYDSIFEQASLRVGLNYPPALINNFIIRFDSEIAHSFKFALFISFILFIMSIFTYLKNNFIYLSFGISLPIIMIIIQSFPNGSSYTKNIGAPEYFLIGDSSFKYSNFIYTQKQHKLEEFLEKVGAKQKGKVSYRIHHDSFFGDLRSATLDRNLSIEPNSTYNKFRLLPNFLSSNYFPVTTGYTNLIPGGNSYVHFLQTDSNVYMQRAIGGGNPELYPVMLKSLGIKWVIRLKSDVSIINGYHINPSSPANINFLQNSKLIYMDDIYEVYEYMLANETVNIPSQIIFSDNSVQAVKDHFLNYSSNESPVILSANEINNFIHNYNNKNFKKLGDGFLIDNGKGIINKIKYSNNQIYMELNSDSSYYLLRLGIRYDRWWKLKVNGIYSPLIKCDNVFACVYLPKGVSSIHLEIVPTSFLIGLCISLFTIISISIYLIYKRWVGNRPLKAKV